VDRYLQQRKDMYVRECLPVVEQRTSLFSNVRKLRVPTALSEGFCMGYFYGLSGTVAHAYYLR